MCLPGIGHSQIEWPKKVKAESVKISYFYQCENFRRPKVWNIHESVKTSDKEWNLKTRISEHAEQMEFLFFFNLTWAGINTETPTNFSDMTTVGILFQLGWNWYKIF